MEDRTKDKVAAIYELRTAAEEKARAEVAVETDPASRAAKDALLDAQLEVEAKTQDAIDVCHECGHGHDPAQEHVAGPARVAARRDNVLEVDFRPQVERG